MKINLKGEPEEVDLRAKEEELEVQTRRVKQTRLSDLHHTKRTRKG